MSNGWRVTHFPNGEKHLTPLNDQREHEPGKSCWCRPRAPCDDHGAWVHHRSEEPLRLFLRGDDEQHDAA